MQAYRHPLHGELQAFTVGTGKVIFEFHGGKQKWFHNNMTVVEVRQEFKRCSIGPDGTADTADDCFDASGSGSAAQSESVEAPEVEVCGSPTSAGQDVKPERTRKAESHRRRQSDSPRSSPSSFSSEPITVPRS